MSNASWIKQKQVDKLMLKWIKFKGYDNLANWIIVTDKQNGFSFTIRLYKIKLQFVIYNFNHNFV